MKTSLGIWALGPMVTRFVPGGYQPQHRDEPIGEKVHRAVEGLGDLMDDYEFHYPGELNPDNLDEVRAALDGHGIYAVAGGLHVDERFQRGGLTNLDDKIRNEALRILLEAADLAGEVGAQMIIWPGGEGYNYPFQVPYAETWARLIDGIGQTAERLASHGRLLFLEHKNSEPAMKIHMANIGMTLFVIHKLRERGIDNVKVNMDWQHLIMNGEHLPEYAALLAVGRAARPPARELRLGHVRRRQHGRRDGVHGDARARARAAPGRLRRQRRAARLRPLSVHGGSGGCGEALGAAVEFHRLRAAKIDDVALREAQQEKDAVRAYELVYAALGA